MTAWPVTVYYDASCPLCSAEIGAMKSRDAHGRLRLVDCSAPELVAPEGFPREALMSRIHARDGAGAWMRGMDVFAAVYEAGGFPRLARLYRSRTLRPLFDRMYPWIADHRQWLSALGLPRVFGFARGKGCAACESAGPRTKV